VSKREEDIPDFAKESKSVKVERKFVRSKSVFKHWFPDDLSKLPVMAEGDIYFWKIGPKVIKEE
jgi:hypothetical protein